MFYYLRAFPTIALAGLLLATANLGAAVTQFTLDPAKSQITLAGTVLGKEVTQQGPGSLTTSFAGTIAAELNGASIRFTGGSFLDAQTNGVWKPGPGGASGSAPADFGAQASTVLGSIRGALRNLQLDLISGPIEIKDGQFNAIGLTFAFLTNSGASFDYDAGLILGAKGLPLSGMSTNIVSDASLTSTPEGQTLTIKVDTEFKFTAFLENDSTVHLSGMLVATAPDLPIITSVEVKDGKVILRVTGTGPAPKLDGSTNLTNWTTRAPEQTTDGNEIILTLPATAPYEYYRVQK